MTLATTKCSPCHGPEHRQTGTSCCMNPAFYLVLCSYCLKLFTDSKNPSLLQSPKSAIGQWLHASSQQSWYRKLSLTVEAVAWTVGPSEKEL